MTCTPKGNSIDTAAPLAADDEELDNRVISALLDTTTETEQDATHLNLTRRNQVRILPITNIHHFEILTRCDHQADYVTRSSTFDALYSNEHCSSSSPGRASGVVFSQRLNIPYGSAERGSVPYTQESFTDSPGQRGIGLLRPLTRSPTTSFALASRPARRILQSSSSSALTSTARYQGGSSIRRFGSAADKVSHSVTSVLGPDAQIIKKRDTGTDDLGGRSKLARSKTKHVFAKFAGVISDHFSTKGSHREDKSHDTTNETTSAAEAKPAQIIDGLPLPRLTLAPLSLTNRAMPNYRHSSMSEDMNVEMHKAAMMTGRAVRPPAVARKRLTIVDEVTIQDGSLDENPFSDSASSHPSAETGVELKGGSGKAPTLTDPFQAERILDTNVDAILDTPPVGFSTPRRRSHSSWVHQLTPTRPPKTSSSDSSDLIDLSDSGSSIKTDRQRRIPIILGIPVRGPVSDGVSSQSSTHHDGQDLHNRGPEMSDSTRLSSYPPGSTIRHVPRSMGRLTEVPVLSVHRFQQNNTFPIARKKHPSPSKVQLELYGKYMENNLALGVFHDPDELGLSFETPQSSPGMLSPRDTNHLMRGGDTTFSNIDLRQDFFGHGNRLGSSNTRSRIPQPVKKVYRPRTETALAKSLYPANVGDMSSEDELHWDPSAYKIGHRCNHCGSMNKL